MSNSAGYVVALTSAVLWGLVYTLDEKVLYKISPTVLLLIHSVISCIVYVVMLVYQREIRSLPAVFNNERGVLLMVLIAVLTGIAANFTITLAIKYIGASTATFFEILYPFFVILFSFFLFKRTVSFSFLIGGVLIFLGSFIIYKYS